MTDQDVLKKAINIALKKGMNHKVVDEGTFYQTYARIKLRHGETYHPTGFSPKDCYGLIFNHDFVKAFFGDGENMNREFDDFGSPTYRYSCGSFFNKPEWQYHLQNMVLHKNPIDYLRIFTE